VGNRLIGKISNRKKIISFSKNPKTAVYGEKI